MEEVRRSAAERGVSQQAIYFQNESIEHNKQAENWQKATIGVAVILILYAAISATLHKWDWIEPKDTYEGYQLGLSKILVFSVLAYLLFLSARNFLSHKHNAIVNKHRQNALLTFNALVNAAGGQAPQDVVLTYAAACIFSPQETGYTKGSSGQADMPTNIIQALPKIIAEK
ncbi:MAG: hypothetical protein HY282_16400 [Nitrospirae bacterium]|nr:hypothetical protein [Candidatus Manganitrophaceae bacterium]